MTDDPEWTYLNDRHFKVRLRVRMNRLYQQRRQVHFELAENSLKVLSIVMGSAAMANLSGPVLLQVFGGGLVAFAAASLVFGWGNKARDAGRRAVEWAGLERDIEAVGERTFTEAHLAQWFARCSDIEATEPAMARRLLERCYRQACESFGVKPSPGGPSAAWMPDVVVP